MRRWAGLWALAALWAGGASAEPLYGAGRDYLTPELRASVEALKAEVAQNIPTTMNNLDARLNVLWPWSNVLSQQGVNMPVELPRVVSQGRQINLRRQYAMVVLPALNGFVRELEIKEEDPGAIGAVTANAAGPWPVRSLVSFEQTYTVGDMPMQPGGGVMVASEIVARMAPFQRDDPKAKNFISIRCSNPAAQWEAATEQVLGMHGSIFDAAGVPAYTLKGATLNKGDTITIVYGDKSGGGPGLELQTTQVQGAMFPLYVDLEGTGNFLTPRWPVFTIIGGEAARVTAVAPSVLAPGESFDLKVRTEDMNFNRASTGIPTYAISLNGTPVSTLAPGKDGIGEVPGLAIPAPGVYRYEVASADGKIRALSNPILVMEKPPYRVFWGDTHAHTNMAEGQGNIEGFYNYARNDARLDFVCLSEHDIWMDDGEWTAMGDAVRTHNDEGNFVTYLAYEWTAIVEAGGHHNVYFKTPEARRRVPIQETPGLWDLFSGLDRLYPAGDVMIIPHAHIPGDWRLAHPRIEPLVEMASMHGTFEWFADYYLRNGHMIGFVGASDDHSGRPGYSGGFIAGPLQHFGGFSAVLAPEKRSGAIFEAMQDRLAYATSGQRILLDVRLNNALMGRRVNYSAQRRIEGRVLGTAPIDRVDLIKNGHVLTTTHYLTQTRAPEGWLQVALYSQSEDFIRDAPRGDRIWLGTLDIEGAELVSAEAIGLGNYEGEWVKRDETNPKRVLFRMSSRGAEERMLLHLKGVSDATRLKMRTEPTDEEGVTFPRTYVAAKQIPVVDLDFSFAGFNGGELTRTIPAGRYEDTVALRWIDPKGALDQPISYTDTESPADGDYYYLRVTQLDGRMAWSSPWWVGGIPVR